MLKISESARIDQRIERFDVTSKNLVHALPSSNSGRGKMEKEGARNGSEKPHEASPSCWPTRRVRTPQMLFQKWRDVPRIRQRDTGGCDQDSLLLS